MRGRRRSPRVSTAAFSKPWRRTERTSCSASKAAGCSVATSACPGVANDGCRRTRPGHAVARADRRDHQGGAERRRGARIIRSPGVRARPRHPRSRARPRGDRVDLRRVDQQSTIGEALLDQRVVAGIGNIWRSESLWQARVSPWSRLSDLVDDDLLTIVGQAAALMADARDGNPPRREVYRRTGRPCRRCAAVIQSGKQGESARTVYWCHSCQQGKEPGGA